MHLSLLCLPLVVSEPPQLLLRSACLVHLLCRLSCRLLLTVLSRVRIFFEGIVGVPVGILGDPSVQEGELAEESESAYSSSGLDSKSIQTVSTGGGRFCSLALLHLLPTLD